MKIAVICLGDAYNEGFGYQENLLSKYQAKDNEVYLFANRFKIDKEGNYKAVKLDEYTNKDGVHVKRLDYKFNEFTSRIFHNYKGLYEELEKIKPDLIFSHSVQYYNILDLVKYKKRHNEVVIEADNHADFTNSAMNYLTKLFHKLVWKRLLKKAQDYIDIFYGVTESRCDFLTDFYGLNKDKVKLLVMGVDDEVREASMSHIDKTKEAYNPDNKFLIVTGGKIDIYKKETINLLKAFNSLNNDDLKLIVFGSVQEELKNDFDENLGKATYVGWKNQSEITDLLCISDLAIYPGRHSVLWEQTLGCGIPMIVKDIYGTHHVYANGSSLILSDLSVDSLKNSINDLLINDKKKYIDMLNKAKEYGYKEFSYKEIARRTLEDAKRIKSTLYR